MNLSSSLPSCRTCAAPLDPTALSCPNCRALTRSSELEALASKAGAAAATNDMPAARQYWQECLALLPADTVQYKSIQARIAEIDGKAADTAAHDATGQHWGKRAAGGVGPIAILAWKFKAVALILLTKGKLLLLGLTKLSTLLSMFASVGVYWALYGWFFAIGLVLSIYVHEMGHVLELRKFGIPADAPMFIPGFGAFVRLRRLSITPVQDARIGLAGPIYGLGAAIAALGASYFIGSKAWAAVAHLGAVINLFNLIPIWQLDGSRGFHSLTQRQRSVIVGLALILWFVTSEPMLFLIALVAAFRLFQRDAAAEPDSTGLLQFAALLVALSGVVVFARLAAA